MTRLKKFGIGDRILIRDEVNNIVTREVSEISPSGIYVKYKYTDVWVEYKNIKVLDILLPSTNLVKGA